MSQPYSRTRVRERIREYEVNGRPILTVSGDNAQYYGLIKKSLEDSLSHLVENPEEVIIDYDLLGRAGLLQNLTELLYVTDGAIAGINVLDLGCGSTEQKDYFSENWLPYMTEMLTRMGANVTGVDYRPNPRATYTHRTIDLVRQNTYSIIEILRGDYDLIVAKSLSDGLVGKAFNSEMEDRILEIIGSLLHSDQLMITDLDVTRFGFKPVFFREMNTLWYR